MADPENIVSQIQSLQTQETQLYNELEASATHQSSPQQIDDILERIQQISSLKQTLYHNLSKDLMNSKQSIESISEQILTDVESTKVIERQVQEARARAMDRANVRGNKARMVEIGMYETERYQTHKAFLQWILMFIVALIVVVVLLKYNIIPSVVGSSLMTIIIVTMIIMSIMKLYDMYQRSNMDYSKYDWSFDKAQASDKYQTVWDHDVNAIRKGETELKAGLKSATQSVNKLATGQ